MKVREKIKKEFIMTAKDMPWMTSDDFETEQVFVPMCPCNEDERYEMHDRAEALGHEYKCSIVEQSVQSQLNMIGHHQTLTQNNLLFIRDLVDFKPVLIKDPRCKITEMILIAWYSMMRAYKW